VFYCPPQTVSETATLTGVNGMTQTAAFSVVDLGSYNVSYNVLPGLGGPNGDSAALDLGLPFFYGHNVFTAIENSNTPGGVGPYFAY
jgi:hypothetical protein